jgi:hypothetical protein
VVVNVSSALGSFWAVTDPERRQFHFEPGFTATDLTPFSGAGQPVEKGAEVVVRKATIGKDDPTGSFQEGEIELAW